MNNESDVIDNLADLEAFLLEVEKWRLWVKRGIWRWYGD